MERELSELLGTIHSGYAILFTGAGFAVGARDRRGRTLPSSEQMAKELWQLVFGDAHPDRSSLCDLFDVAMRRDRDAVVRYLDERLTVGEVPAHAVAWFAAPWRRIYTLDVDDLEVATRRAANVPKTDVIHLNGMVGGDLDQMTFSTLQYAERLIARQPAYEQLAEDLEHAPFVFVGTTLDEVVLWQHVMLRSLHKMASSPRSFLVARSLTRARAVLLDALGITWLPLSAEDAATELFPSLAPSMHRSGATR
ncbi:MAG TPA: SIR2 family protein [Kofleriaceae bacterium]|nr:SIR2 family protein [Kofleriaceae bacterium]